MKPNKYLFRAFSLASISLLSFLLIGTTGASAHDLNQFTPVTTDQNQNNNSGNNDDNNTNDNNNNGGGGYIPGGIPGGGSSNNNNGGRIPTGGATAGATTNNGSATVVSNPQGQSTNGTNNSTAEGMTGVNDSAGSATTKTGSAVTSRSSNQTQFQSNNSKNNGASASGISQEQPQNKGTRNSHSDHYAQKSMHSNGQFQPSNKPKHKSYKTTWKKGEKLDRNQRREVRYERKHYKKYNKHYPNLGHFNDGGDCTNWASQDRLHAGGKMTSSAKHVKGHYPWSKNKWSKSPRKWYCRQTKPTKIFGKVLQRHWNYSTSWSTVNGFYKYWTKVKHRPHFATSSFRKVMARVHVGDVVQLHSKGQGWHHTLTISKITKHMVYYTSHNYNRLFAPLTKIKSFLGTSRTNKMRVIEMGV